LSSIQEASAPPTNRLIIPSWPPATSISPTPWTASSPNRSSPGSCRTPAKWSAGLRALKADQEAHAAKVQALRAAIQEADDDLAAGRFEKVEDIDAYMSAIADEVEAEFEAGKSAVRTPAE